METPLASQSASTVYSKEEQIAAFVQAAYPTLDLSPGTALRDLVVRIYAHLETRIQEQIDLALVSSSLSEISKDPSAVDAAQLERVLSIWARPPEDRPGRTDVKKNPPEKKT